MTRIRIAAGGTGFNFLPIYVAERHGLFAKTGSKSRPRYSERGQGDGGCEGRRVRYRDHATGGRHPRRGRWWEFACRGRNVNRLPLSLISHPRFARIEDLKGAVLGTSSLTEGTALYTMEVLRRHGLNYPGDYTFNVVGLHPARWKALQEGTSMRPCNSSRSISSPRTRDSEISAR